MPQTRENPDVNASSQHQTCAFDLKNVFGFADEFHDALERMIASEIDGDTRSSLRQKFENDFRMSPPTFPFICLFQFLVA